MERRCLAGMYVMRPSSMALAAMDVGPKLLQCLAGQPRSGARSLVRWREGQPALEPWTRGATTSHARIGTQHSYNATYIQQAVYATMKNQRHLQ